MVCRNPAPYAGLWLLILPSLRLGLFTNHADKVCKAILKPGCERIVKS